MTAPNVELTRRVEFAASHRLHNPVLSDEENRSVFGICNNLHGHGHNYELEVTVRGPVPSRTGMVLDLHRLDELLQEEIVSQVDHRHLDHDVPFLQGVVSTAENLVVAFWDRIERRLESFEGCQLCRIRLYENRNSFVDYLGPRS